MPFHSLTLPFRAVEARVGIVRSSNTGISGFVKPSGETYGEVANAEGETWTGLGAPELDLIEEVVEIRRKREHEIAGDPLLRARLVEGIEEIKRLRARAGISGHSTQTVWVDPRRTLYSRTGDVFGTTLLAVYLLGSAGSCGWHRRAA